jgi:Uma2 family endonuclease
VAPPVKRAGVMSMRDPLSAPPRDPWAGMPMTPEQYRDLEERDRMKWEYFGGRAYPWTGYDDIDPVTGMAGVSIPHPKIQMNLLELLSPSGRAVDWQAWLSEVRFVYDAANNRYFCADTMVSCEEPQEIAGVAALVQPCVVVEVLSRSNRQGSSGILFAQLVRYLVTPSIQTVLLIEQDQQLAYVHARQPDGDLADPEEFTEGSIPLPCLQIELSLDDFYRNVVPRAG